MIVIVSGVLVLLGTLALIAALVISVRRPLEDERRRLAVTIESLGDGLLVPSPAPARSRSSTRGPPS